MIFRESLYTDFSIYTAAQLMIRDDRRGPFFLKGRILVEGKKEVLRVPDRKTAYTRIQIWTLFPPSGQIAP